jgi:hypothetical protein
MTRKVIVTPKIDNKFIIFVVIRKSTSGIPHHLISNESIIVTEPILTWSHTTF